MAFKPKEKEIAKILEDTDVTSQQPEIIIPSFETKKQYQFTLKPSNREKLNRLAQAAGARSASDYLDRVIESISEQ